MKRGATRFTPKQRRQLRQMMMDLTSVREAADKLDVSYQTIYNELQLGMSKADYKKRRFVKYDPQVAEEKIFHSVMKELESLPGYEEIVEKIRDEFDHVSGTID